jgi:predicted dehydrogenase
MLGETSYYYPAAIYCRQRFAAGDFGQVVYAQAEYYHDWDEGLYDVMKQRGGSRWLEFAGLPPMYYPTHSMSFVVSVTGAHVTHVSCHGFVDRAGDGIYQAEVNRWGNAFSNETALCRMSDGSCSVVNEFRRVGYPSAERLNLLVGTQASFHSSASGDAWVTKDRTQQTALDNLLATGDRSTERGTYLGLAAVHPVERLPSEFAGLPNEHRGSHQFLVDDFVRACAEGHQPPNNVWMAARYVVPGLVAHESARRGGELLAVPDFGGPPVA